MLNQPMASHADVTVLLVLKGRESFTPRWLKFHRLADLACPVIIGDGISSQTTKNLAQQFEQSSGCRVLYMPFDERSVEDYYWKLRGIVSAASTQFVHLCANDDFISPLGLAASAKFLAQHPDYVSCGGAVMGFFLVDDSFDISRGSAAGTQCLNLGVLYPDVDIREDTARKRVAASLESYTPTYYAVHRRDALLEVLDELIVSKIKDVRIAELFIVLHLAIRGRQKLAPGYLGYLRQRNSSQTYASLTDFFDSAVAGTVSQDARLLLQSLSDKCAADEPDAHLVFQAALVSHFRQQFMQSAGRVGIGASALNFIKAYLHTIRAKIPLAHRLMKNAEWSRLKVVLRAGGADKPTLIKVRREIELALSACRGGHATIDGN